MLFLEACKEQVALPSGWHTSLQKWPYLKRNTSGIITRLHCVECSLPYFYVAKGYGCLLWVSDVAQATGRFYLRALQEARYWGFFSALAEHLPYVRNSSAKWFPCIGSPVCQRYTGHLTGDPMQPKVSVLIPVYNAAKYLPLCLASLSKQTLTEFEIVCLNDGSSDNSLQILNRAAQNEPRLRVLSQPNQGVAAARNRLLKEATGTYIAFVDADDFIFPTYLEKLYFAAERAQADVSRCLFYEVEESGFPRVREHCHRSFYQSCPAGDAKRFRGGYEDAVLWGKLFRHNWMQKHNFHFLPDCVAEDFPVVILAYLLARTLVLVPEKLYCYRKGVSSAITANSLKMAIGILENLLSLQQTLQIHGKWNAQTAHEWIRAAVWGVCRFRKFPHGVRQQYRDLQEQVWQTARAYVPVCVVWQQVRWRMLFALTFLCGKNSIYLWSKIFR